MMAPEMETPGTAVAAAAQARNESTDATIIRDQAEVLKALLMQRAARAGICVHESFGGYVVGCGAFREVPDLRTLSRCLSSMGVRA